MKRPLLSFLLPLLLLAGCSYEKLPSVELFPDAMPSSYGVRYSIIGLAVGTPPINNVIFGPCTEEFGMPDSRQANCNFYHAVRGRTPPWDNNTAAGRAGTYPSQVLYCQRTLSGVPECIVAAGQLKQPQLLAPNMGSN